MSPNSQLPSSCPKTKRKWEGRRNLLFRSTTQKLHNSCLIPSWLEDCGLATSNCKGIWKIWPLWVMYTDRTAVIMWKWKNGHCRITGTPWQIWCVVTRLQESSQGKIVNVLRLIKGIFLGGILRQRTTNALLEDITVDDMHSTLYRSEDRWEKANDLVLPSSFCPTSAPTHFLAWEPRGAVWSSASGHKF